MEPLVSIVSNRDCGGVRVWERPRHRGRSQWCQWIEARIEVRIFKPQ